MFHDRSLLWRCFRGFLLHILKYCSAVWCPAAETHLEQPDRSVSGARFLTVVVFECDISHRRSVSVLWMLYKIMRNRCTLLMVIYLGRLCQCGLLAVLWSHIGKLLLRLAEKSRGTARLFSPSQCPSGTTGSMLSYWPMQLNRY